VFRFHTHSLSNGRGVSGDEDRDRELGEWAEEGPYDYEDEEEEDEKDDEEGEEERSLRRSMIRRASMWSKSAKEEHRHDLEHRDDDNDDLDRRDDDVEDGDGDGDEGCEEVEEKSSENEADEEWGGMSEGGDGSGRDERRSQS
jgi:hypothetical protein